MNEEQKFEDYRNRLNIRDVLTDAGYTLHKRDGLRYPAYVRLDNDGRRIRGDKFIVMPNKNCCFQPPNCILSHPSFGNIRTSFLNTIKE